MSADPLPPEQEAERITDRWEELERSCLHAERLKDEGLPFHCILSLRGLIAESLSSWRARGGQR